MKKKIKLNSLQNKTLALFQELAKQPDHGKIDAETGEITVAYLPQPHGNHVHIGHLSFSTRDISGFSNNAVWKALEKKGLAKSNFPSEITLTKLGLEFDTGLSQNFEVSDH